MTTTIHTITKEELSQRIHGDSDAQIVNVLNPEHYKLGMIPGSQRIPLAQLDDRMDELDKCREVITYCASRACPMSRLAAEKLADHGFDVKAYEGGIKEWLSSGLPSESRGDDDMPGDEGAHGLHFN